MRNNATNIPYLDTPSYLLIGNGTAPIVGPLLGGTGITVTPSGTAISLSTTSSYQNYLDTFIWGEASSPFLIDCSATTFCSSVFGMFNGAVKQIRTFWGAVGTGNSFVISIWKADKASKIGQTASFTPIAGLNTAAISVTAPIVSGTTFWIELRPTSSGGGWNVYGIKDLATQDINFNIQSASQGSTPLAPNDGTFTASMNRVWFYCL